jgi:hypothetical protein
MRVTGWVDVLNDHIEAVRSRPFEWGVWDCCQFAAETVLAITGKDYREAFPTYQSRADAIVLIHTHGSVVELLSSVLGSWKHPAHAQRGDVVAADFGDGIAAGICLGVNSAAVGPAGLVFRPTETALAAWTI